MANKLRVGAIVVLVVLLAIRLAPVDGGSIIDIVKPKGIIAKVAVVEDPTQRTAHPIIARLITADWTEELKTKDVQAWIQSEKDTSEDVRKKIDGLDLPVALVVDTENNVLGAWTIKAETIDQFYAKIEEVGTYADSQ